MYIHLHTPLTSHTPYITPTHSSHPTHLSHDTHTPLTTYPHRRHTRHKKKQSSNAYGSNPSFKKSWIVGNTWRMSWEPTNSGRPLLLTQGTRGIKWRDCSRLNRNRSWRLRGTPNNYSYMCVCTYSSCAYVLLLTLIIKRVDPELPELWEKKLLVLITNYSGRDLDHVLSVSRLECPSHTQCPDLTIFGRMVLLVPGHV